MYGTFQTTGSLKGQVSGFDNQQGIYIYLYLMRQASKIVFQYTVKSAYKEPAYVECSVINKDFTFITQSLFFFILGYVYKELSRAI